mmetsp:Transcript_16825/g.54771  ORF Transcript_16825/g.54771 Transcript_16825/m.54771 type:complete len:238 (+) Transcript_16825:578-1291(+)
MGEGELPGVEEGSLDPEGRLRRELVMPGVAVEVVAEDGGPEVCEVDADLVRAARGDVDLDDGPLVVRGEGSYGGLGIAGAPGDVLLGFVDVVGGHAIALRRMSRDQSFDVAFFCDFAGADRQVEFPDLAVPEGIRQGRLRKGGLRRDDDAGRSLVESMDDAGSTVALVVDVRLAIPVGQSVRQGPRRPPRRGVGDHARRLVDDDHVVIFVDDLQRQVFRDRGAPQKVVFIGHFDRVA